MAILNEGDGPWLSKLFNLMMDVIAYILLRGNQGLNTFSGKERPERETHWLNPRDLSRFLIKHGELQVFMLCD